MVSTTWIIAMFLLLEAQFSLGRMVPSNLGFLVQGSPFLFNGFNSYWMMKVASDPDNHHKVTDAFREASTAGLTVCRTWAFGDGGDPALQISPGVYDERVFQRVVTRLNVFTGVSYRDEAMIMAWELMNEPRCQTDYSGATLNVTDKTLANKFVNVELGWVQEMASFVKSIDKNHLLELGMEGFYGDSIPQRKQVNPGYEFGTDFISNNLVKEIDFATIHAYPDVWLPGKSEDEQKEFMERWMWNHWEDARYILKKPLVIAEFGRRSKDGLVERDLYIGSIYRDVFRYATSGGTMSVVGQWKLDMASDGTRMDDYHDGYEIILSQSPSTSGIISRQSHAMNALMSQFFTRDNIIRLA
ncbi:hypothetical protein SASPL_147945 [Salvia splendens]|uniref:mannan endo-1,4-beta-mannosidase n=1 Tax=Salvia splendens TaxID=180675 RepID=A0A8X8W957_SALSN|nr:hypothetical protein SASPL_147945 [Salvia splendens]